MQSNRDFYLIYPLGLANLGLSELNEKWNDHFPDSTLLVKSVDFGGILISCELSHGLLLNHILKTPTRILLRIAEFKARDFPKLFNKISKLPWKDYLLGQCPEVEAASTNSKLFDSRKISKAIIDGVMECYKKQPVKKKFLDLASNTEIQKYFPTIYYRSVDDLVTISIDTTGERLHKRGEKIFTGLAPIRESFAAILLRALTQDLASIQDFTLIDPMCGSGTFLIEAHDQNTINTDRSFAYQYFPIAIDDAQLKTTLIQLHQTSEDKYKNSFKKLLGFEINPEIVELAQKNCGDKKISIKEADLFKSNKDGIFNQQNIVIINPPYGHRIGEKSEITLSYYTHLISTINKVYAPERLGIIIPDEYCYKPDRKELRSSFAFKNGGIPVTFFVLDRLGS
ncbi:MAG: N-6 DNA methylase [Bacteriovoracaceae bacterium]|nr:N-6 DNA methylase [Bacteriovoracaceae bacterium]